VIHRASAVFISNADPAYLAGRPRHNRGKARDIVEKLALGIFAPIEFVALEDALCPDYQLAIGAYDRGLYFSFPDEMYGCIETLNNPILNKLLSQYPKAHVLAIELNRTKNYFGYVLYRKGKMERRLLGDMVRGVFIDEGEMQPEEKPHFAKSIVKDGRRYFPSTAAIRAPWEAKTMPASSPASPTSPAPGQSQKEDSGAGSSKAPNEEPNEDPNEEMYVYGETLVSAMMATFIGPPEKNNLGKLQVEIFE
jgi:hypothetical protein